MALLLCPLAADVAGLWTVAHIPEGGVGWIVEGLYVYLLLLLFLRVHVSYHKVHLSFFFFGYELLQDIIFLLVDVVDSLKRRLILVEVPFEARHLGFCIYFVRTWF